MTATALIQLTQATNIGPNGQSLIGVVGTAVTLSNTDNTGVASWQIDLVYADPSSALVPATPYAFNNSSATPTLTFTPDVSGCYRLVLKVWGVANRVGTPTDLDIRIFGVKEANGTLVPPAQVFPQPLPVPASGKPGAKPSEYNFDGVPNGAGWAGNGSNDGLLNNTLRIVDAINTKSTHTLYVDVDTTVPFALQTGSKGLPFSSIDDAFSLIGSNSGTATNWYVMVGPGQYPSSGTTINGGNGTICRNIWVEGSKGTVLGSGGSNTFYWSSSEAANNTLSFSNLTLNIKLDAFASTTESGVTHTIEFHNVIATAGTIHTDFTSDPVLILAYGTMAANPTNTYISTTCQFGEIRATTGNIILRGSSFNSIETATDTGEIICQDCYCPSTTTSDGIYSHNITLGNTLFAGTIGATVQINTGFTTFGALTIDSPTFASIVAHNVAVNNGFNNIRSLYGDELAIEGATLQITSTGTVPLVTLDIRGLPSEVAIAVRAVVAAFSTGYTSIYEWEAIFLKTSGSVSVGGQGAGNSGSNGKYGNNASTLNFSSNSNNIVLSEFCASSQNFSWHTVLYFSFSHS